MASDLVIAWSVIGVVVVMAGVAGFCLGQLGGFWRGYKTGHRDGEREAAVSCPGLRVWIEPKAVDAWLDRRGLIAMPKGVDLAGKERSKQS